MKSKKNSNCSMKESGATYSMIFEDGSQLLGGMIIEPRSPYGNSEKLRMSDMPAKKNSFTEGKGIEE